MTISNRIQKPDLRPYLWHCNNTVFHSWFERDRAHVRIENTRGELIFQLWDNAVTEFVNDGFKSRRQSWHDALCEYATNHKMRVKK